MSGLLDLSTELIWYIAAYLDQVDLLNVSLTCRFLRETTERELFREYSNPQLYGRALAKLVVRILQKPELARHIKHLDLKAWDTMSDLDPTAHEPIGLVTGKLDPDDLIDGKSLRDWKTASFDETEVQAKYPRPTRDEYIRCTEAAKAAGLIKDIFPYEDESVVMRNARTQLSTDFSTPDEWYLHLFDEIVATPDIPYDRKFCQLLSAGIEDAYEALLLALLPNVEQIVIRGLANEPDHILSWPQTSLGFGSVRHLAVGATDLQLTWGIGYINPMLAQAPLESLYLQGAGSWYRDTLGQLPWEQLLRPLAIQPRSLPITRIEMLNCALLKSDMQTLVLACPQLRSLLYWTGTRETGPENFSAGDLIEVLESVKDTLEELYAEIQPYWTDFDQLGRIDSLTHFTALKILDTTPDMWFHLSQDTFSTWQNEVRALEDDQRICQRLPPSIQILRFHTQEDHHHLDISAISDIPDPCQIEDLLLQAPHLLPELKEVFIGSNWAVHARKIKRIVDKLADDLGNLSIEIGVGTSSGGPTQSLWHRFAPSFMLGKVQWQGTQYVTVAAEDTDMYKIELESVDECKSSRKKTDGELMREEMQRQERLFATGERDSYAESTEPESDWDSTAPGTYLVFDSEEEEQDEWDKEEEEEEQEVEVEGEVDKSAGDGSFSSFDVLGA